MRVQEDCDHGEKCAVRSSLFVAVILVRVKAFCFLPFKRWYEFVTHSDWCVAEHHEHMAFVFYYKTISEISRSKVFILSSNVSYVKELTVICIVYPYH